MEEKIIKQKDFVKGIMESFPEARNNDAYLAMKCWERSHGLKIVIFKDGKPLTPEDCPYLENPESFIRHRASLQNEDNTLLPTRPSVLSRRQFAEEKIKAYYGEHSQVWQDWKESQCEVRCVKKNGEVEF